MSVIRLRHRVLHATCALLVLVSACGPAEDADGAAATQPPAPHATPEPKPAIDPNDPVAGLWWVYAPKFPIHAFRISLEPGAGETRAGTWVTFDWRGTTDPETLARRSKPVRIEAKGDSRQMIIEGPAPMLTDAGQPNGHSGRWRLDLRRAELPGEPLRWSGTATHDGGMTGTDGVTVDMERGFHRWQ